MGDFKQIEEQKRAELRAKLAAMTAEEKKAYFAATIAAIGG